MSGFRQILIFHKHRLEKDTKYPCSECGSLNVKSNSYTSRGLRSWECKNEYCNRTENNRGKRFSLKTIIVQNPSLQENNIIPSELVKDWRRDIHKLNPVIKINSKKENLHISLEQLVFSSLVKYQICVDPRTKKK